MVMVETVFTPNDEWDHIYFSDSWDHIYFSDGWDHIYFSDGWDHICHDPTCFSAQKQYMSKQKCVIHIDKLNT